MISKNLEEEDRSLKNYLFFFLIKYRFYFLVLSIIAIVAGVLDVAVYYKVKQIVDVIGLGQKNNLSLLLLLFVLTLFLRHALHFIHKFFGIRYKPRMLKEALGDIYTKTLAHSLYWFDSHLAGEVSSKITDFQQGIGSLTTAFFSALHVIATIATTLLFLFYVSLPAAFVLIFFIFTHIIITAWLLKKQSMLAERYFSSRQNVIGIVNDSIANIVAIKTVGNLYKEMESQFIPAVSQLGNWEKKLRKWNVYFLDNADVIMMTLMSATQICLLSSLYEKEMITAGGFVFILMIVLNIRGQFEKLLGIIFTNISPTVAQIKSAYHFVSNPIDVKDKQEATSLRHVTGKIDYDRVSFSYGMKNRRVLCNVSLSVQPHEKLGVVGASGAGKTTLVKCLLRYFDVSSGSVAIDGRDIRDVTQDSLREVISIIPQDITLFHRSIRENLQIAKYDATEAEIIAACKCAQIHEEIIAMVKGYDSIVGERGIKLSGGQRQRIAIARAILKNAPILTNARNSPPRILPTVKFRWRWIAQKFIFQSFPAFVCNFSV